MKKKETITTSIIIILLPLQLKQTTDKFSKVVFLMKLLSLIIV